MTKHLANFPYIFYAYQYMKHVGLTLFLAAFITSFGLFLFLLQVFSIFTDPYPWLIDIASVALLLTGTFIFIRIKLAQDAFLEKQMHPGTGTTHHVKKESLIEKQRKLLSEWEDTSHKRDKLKMLKLVSAAEE